MRQGQNEPRIFDSTPPCGLDCLSRSCQLALIIPAAAACLFVLIISDCSTNNAVWHCLHSLHAAANNCCCNQVRARLDTLKQQEEKLCLAQHLSRLTDKHKQLESEVQQLTQTLTTSKQANVMARSRVAAAVSETESELKESKVS